MEFQELMGFLRNDGVADGRSAAPLFCRVRRVFPTPGRRCSPLDKADFLHHFSPSVRFIPYILLFLVLRAAAESAASSEVVVRVWQSQYGLPSNVVQGSDGYLWVATAEGVARFEGFEFQVIEPGGELRRQRLAFSRLFATSGGQIWAATYQSGLFRVENGRLRGCLEFAFCVRPLKEPMRWTGGQGKRGGVVKLKR